jgi:hypothetical protein
LTMLRCAPGLEHALLGKPVPTFQDHALASNASSRN